MKNRGVFIFFSCLFFLGGASLLIGSNYLENFLNSIPLSPSFEIKSPSVDLVVGGDIMLSRGIGWWAKKEGYHRIFSGQNYHPLSQFPCYASGDCLLYFNLESMFSDRDNDQPKGGFLFRANTGNIQTLLDLQGNNKLLLSLSNNHTNNAGGAGVHLTRERLGEHNIGFFGAGNSKEDAKAFYQTIHDGLNLCFQAFSYDGTYGKYGKKMLAWNSLNFDDMNEVLDAMKESSCDVKIFGLHWGAEYRIQPNTYQIDTAHHLIDSGVDIILGGHSHIPGAYEMYKDKPIFYSFGNFIFDQDWGKHAKGREFDYIYDYELERNTVPTYIPLMVSLKITKAEDGISITSPVFKMARLNKGIFSPIDSQTFSGIMEKLSLTH